MINSKNKKVIESLLVYLQKLKWDFNSKPVIFHMIYALTNNKSV